MHANYAHVHFIKTNARRHCIDYILATPDVEVRRVLATPDDADVGPGRLPCWRYPSDHISLVAEIALPSSSSEQLGELRPCTRSQTRA